MESMRIGLGFYNPSPNDVDLNGWFLTDKTNNPTKWMFPSSFVVPSLGTVIVYCSGRDEINANNAHSNFKITQTKGNEVTYCFLMLPLYFKTL